MSDTPEVRTVNISSSSPTPLAPSESTPEATTTAPISTPDSVDTSPVETPTEQSESTEEDPRFGDRFAALSREEAKIRQTRLEMKAEQEKLTEYNELREQIKENPMAALEHLGIDLDALIMHSLGGDAPVEEVDPVAKLQKEFEDYKNGLQTEKDDKEAARIEEHNTSVDAAVDSHKKLIEQTLQDNTDKYELITMNNAQDLVWEVTEAHYDETNGEVLSPEEAADKVEAYLDAQFQKMSQSKKYNKEPIQDTAPTPTNEPVVQKINTPTLSNSNSANTPQSSKVETYVDREASKRNAASLLKWD